MKRRFIWRASAMVATSLAAITAQSSGKTLTETKEKKPRPATTKFGSQSSAVTGSTPLPKAPLPNLRAPVISLPLNMQPLTSRLTPPSPSTSSATTKFPWRIGIVTTTFWIGEDAAPKNPVPNHASSWDPLWLQNYGGIDTPVRADRAEFRPAGFAPRQNPFYIALPYNDVTAKGHKPEAPSVIPWFQERFRGEGKTVLKGRWVAIRFRERIAYAQWEDCGPFRTDHAAYVFGSERPKPNLNKGAGLDVSPAVRDYLGMADTDVTDWRFVDFAEVPSGPWALHGENNTFVQRKRATEERLVLDGPISGQKY